MFPKIEKILYATDLSPNSAYALRYAMDSAVKHDAGIIIIHILEPLSATTEALTHAYLTGSQEKKISEEKIACEKDQIRKRLKIFGEKELKKG